MRTRGFVKMSSATLVVFRSCHNLSSDMIMKKRDFVIYYNSWSAFLEDLVVLRGIENGLQESHEQPDEKQERAQK